MIRKESKLFLLLFPNNCTIILTTFLLLPHLASSTSIGYSSNNVEQCSIKNSEHARVCKTSGCIKAASLVLAKMDKSINPCDNFYHYACGKFIKETVIPEDKSRVTTFSETKDRINKQLKESIEQRIQESDPRTLKLLRSYYTICLDSGKSESRSTAEVLSIVNSLGGWPVVLGESWDETTFDWKKLVYRLRKIGYTKSMNSFVKTKIDIDDKNNTRYVISLDQAETGLQKEYLSKGLEDKVVQAYYKYMVDLAELLGADYEQAKEELADSLNFEIALAKISLAKYQRRNMSQLYNLMTVEQLESKYPGVPWRKYLNKLLSTISPIKYTDLVTIKNPGFLKSLSKLISKTPKRVLANYAIWRVIQESVNFMNERARSAKLKFTASRLGTQSQKPRWVQCIDYVSDNMPLATAALYVRKNFDEDSKHKVADLVIELRKSFGNMLKKIDWMGEETRRAALQKLTLMQSNIAYPNELLDDEIIDEYFKLLKEDQQSFLRSHLRLNLFNFDKNLELYWKPVNKSNWRTHGNVAVVNAYYEPVENVMRIPAGILQGEFFSSSRPNYMNYGGIGFSIGHEITHGFDDQGSQYDKDGNLANWWDKETRKVYFKRTQCIIDQYSNYTVTEVGLNVNGKNTLGENIADNGGIKEAYYAYEEYERKNGPEPSLPGLPYSPKQMFWMSAANVWCSKYRGKALKNRIITNVHSPAEFRVIGPFSNMPQFARDFNCPLGSSMNPIKKCTVW